ncbi:hypothetical protein TSUD_364890 [Trifolium subterraneum]|uniref:Major facilitator superfamily (MFS) profile domain-containing protein n=1 Tax=Trifolium subterraneum TaxID=3900 RepID=A0A2Z6MLC1_TRISU|nr:hypothetical protein TSUD_364890 [Trifolium subterraneum]
MVGVGFKSRGHRRAGAPQGCAPARTRLWRGKEAAAEADLRSFPSWKLCYLYCVRPRAYATEIVREEHQALGLSTVNAAWGTGLVIGPALGGYLALPAEKYPHIFPKGSFMDKFPYILPCFVISGVSFVVVIACLWIPTTGDQHGRAPTDAAAIDEFPTTRGRTPATDRLSTVETLHNHDGSNGDESIGDAEATENGTNKVDEEKTVQKNENLFMNWPLMSSIIAYCVFSLHDIAYQEVFSLWCVSPQSLGGLNFSTNDVGNVLAISGFELWTTSPDAAAILRMQTAAKSHQTAIALVKLSGLALVIYQLTLYQYMAKACGPVGIARITGIFSIPLLQSYPFIAMLSGIALYIVISIASVLKNIISVSITTGLFLLQNRAVEQHQRGAANGISLTAMSLFKAIGPATGGTILTWSQKRLDAAFLPGTHMVFFFLNLVEGLGIFMLFKPFLGEKKKTQSDQLH